MITTNVKHSLKSNEKAFPKLMIFSTTGMIVLFFTAPHRSNLNAECSEGVVLKPSDSKFNVYFKVGHTAFFALEGFTDFTGTIELSNS